MSRRKHTPTVMVIHGPNLNLLGAREPDIYGTLSLKAIDREIKRYARSKRIRTICYQSNHEGKIIDFIHANYCGCSGIIINPAAYTHYSIAIRDAVAAANLPAVEVHLSDISAREDFRRKSLISGVCITRISGAGWQGYLRAVDILAERFDLEAS
ncbi:type II 3-dehydroquinate dehydratase [bacterium]|nr:type II 3-dehydroquinate dehydratase [bacterium]